MSLHKWSDHPIQGTPLPSSDPTLDARKRAAQEQAEARERRREELDGQTSMHNSPEQRIRIWERLHDLSLPSKPDHPLIKVVARDTDLRIEQVQEELRLRGEARPAPNS